MPISATITRRKFHQTNALLLASTLWQTPLPTIQAKTVQKRKIKIGQIGTEHGHASKISVYRKSADYEVIGIADRNPTPNQQTRSHPAFRDLNWMSTEQLLNHPDLDAVLIETDVHSSLEFAELCINAGKHIHLDKPAGESLPNFERILNAAKEKKLLVQMGYMYRFNPAWLLLKQLHSSGAIGDIFEVQAVMSKVISDADRKALSTYPGGTMFELGCHLIDLLIDLLGYPSAITPYALHSGPQQDQLLDNMLAVFQYPKATATIKSTALEVEGFARRHLTVCGTKGTVHIQPLDQPKITLSLDSQTDGYQKGIQEITFPKPFERYVSDAEDMAKILRGEADSRWSYEHDLQVQRAVLLASNLTVAN